MIHERLYPLEYPCRWLPCIYSDNCEYRIIWFMESFVWTMVICVYTWRVNYFLVYTRTERYNSAIEIRSMISTNVRLNNNIRFAKTTESNILSLPTPSFVRLCTLSILYLASWNFACAFFDVQLGLKEHKLEMKLPIFPWFKKSGKIREWQHAEKW